jgi:thymidylate synthase
MRRGIRDLIGNVLEHPTITDVVVTGVDCPEPEQRQGDALLNRGFSGESIALDESFIDMFYRRVRIHDARHIRVRDSDRDQQLLRLLGTIRANTDLSAPGYYEPVSIPDLTATPPETFPAQRGGHMVYAETIADAHVQILESLWTFGEVTDPDSEGRRRRELWSLCVHLDTCPSLESVPHYTSDELLRYGEAIWNGDEPDELTYRYGHRMRCYFGDQIAAIKECVRKKPETFRTVISLWQPYESLLLDDQPCLILVHPRIRNGVLDMFAYIRTNEMYEAWPKNASGLRYFQECLVGYLFDVVPDLRIGSLTIMSGSAHVYDHTFYAVEQFLDQTRKTRLVLDPKGSWFFSRVDREGVAVFVAEHRDTNGRVLQLLEATTAERLREKIAPFFTTAGHALWAGEQIGRLR